MEQTLFNSSIQKWIFFTFINTAIFLHFRISGYEVHCLCHNYWPSKITWGKLLSIVGDYDQFTFFIYFKQYLQQLGLRGSLQRRGKRLSWWNIPHMISCLPIWTCLIIPPKKKISSSPGLLMEIMCCPISASTGIGKMLLAFI